MEDPKIPRKTILCELTEMPLFAADIDKKRNLFKNP